MEVNTAKKRGTSKIPITVRGLTQQRKGDEGNSTKVRG